MSPFTRTSSNLKEYLSLRVTRISRPVSAEAFGDLIFGRGQNGKVARGQIKIRLLEKFNIKLAKEQKKSWFEEIGEDKKELYNRL